jgi:hypothetical protein
VDPVYFVWCAAAIIDRMEVAWSEEISTKDSRRRRGFGETRDCITGEPGVVVRSLLDGGRYSCPMAELLVPAGEFKEHGRDAFTRLGASLSKRRRVRLGLVEALDLEIDLLPVDRDPVVRLFRCPLATLLVGEVVVSVEAEQALEQALGEVLLGRSPRGFYACVTGI